MEDANKVDISIKEMATAVYLLLIIATAPELFL
jgi:hypothetical protein